MVAIANSFKRYQRLVALRDAFAEQRDRQLHAAACCSSCGASSGQFFAGAARGLQFAIAAIDAALADEAIDEGRIADAQTDADLREQLDRIRRQARSQAAWNAANATGRRASPPVEGQAGGVLKACLAFLGLFAVVWALVVFRVGEP